MGQALQESAKPSLKVCVVRGCRQQYANAAHPLALLCSRCERPRSRRAAEECDEIAPLQCRPQASRSVPVQVQISTREGRRETNDVRFGPIAEIFRRQHDVRFLPEAYMSKEVWSRCGAPIKAWQCERYFISSLRCPSRPSPLVPSPFPK